MKKYKRCIMKYLRFAFILVLILYSFSCSKKTTTELIKLEAPVFNPVGGTYLAGQAIYITSSEYGTSIYYTVNGSEPTENDSLYDGPLIIPNFFPAGANSATVKARAYKEGFEPSNVSTATYFVTYYNTVTTPIISPVGGNITTETVITIRCTTPEAEIYYTLDGTEPTQNSIPYTEEFTISQTGEVTLKVRAFKPNWNPSEIAIANYVVSNP
jgi:hypothetical protein